MDSIQEPEAGGSEWAPLVDLSEMSILELMASDDSTLARSIQQLLASINDPNGVISAFSSYAG